MRSPIVVCVENGSSFAALLSNHRAGRPSLHVRSADWRSLANGRFSIRDADLLVPTILDDHNGWSRFSSLLRSERVHPPVLAILPETADSELLETVARDADDFMLWQGCRADELRHRIRRMLPSATPLEEDARKVVGSVALAKLIGRDPDFLAMLGRIPSVAKAPGAVLILGETGTGKELCARAVHHFGAQRDHPFVPVDCGAVPDTLLENELFGHSRGAFTDARQQQDGLVGMAEGGSLFLDEVDALPLAAQAKLLRFIESRTYKPLGADRFVQAHVRIMAATNVDLEELVRRRKFRADLYFRLNVLPLVVPPLRERRGDIALLARHFVARVCAEAGIPPKTLMASTLNKLTRADWPGNVRQLLNTIQRAVLFSDGPLVLPDHVATSEPPAASKRTQPFHEARASVLEAFERSYVEALLRKHGGNVTRSALEAGKDRRVFGRLIKKHGLSRSTA